jgi:hypothetical protein
MTSAAAFLWPLVAIVLKIHPRLTGGRKSAFDVVRAERNFGGGRSLSNPRKCLMLRFPAAVTVILFLAAPACAVMQFPHDFHSAETAANGTSLHVRVGGHGPVVVLLHGFRDTGGMWATVAAALAADCTVICSRLARDGPFRSSHSG